MGEGRQREEILSKSGGGLSNRKGNRRGSVKRRGHRVHTAHYRVSKAGYPAHVSSF